MKIIIINTLFLLAPLAISAQNEAENYQHAQYCLSFADYQASNWIDADSITKIYRTDSQIMWSGGTAIRFKGIDNETTKILKNKAFAVNMNDTIYVNLHSLKNAGARWGNGYSIAYPYDNNKHLLFLERYVSRGQNMKFALGGAVGGMVGGFIAAGTVDWTGKVCYLINHDDSKVTCIDGNEMQLILKDKPELLEDYNRVSPKKERRAATYVMPFLKKAGLVNY